MMRSMFYQPVPPHTLCRIRPRKPLRVPHLLPPTDPGWHRGFRLVRPPGKRHTDLVTSSGQVLTDDPIIVPQITPHGPSSGIPGAGAIAPVAPTSHLAPPVPGSGVYVSPGPSTLVLPSDLLEPFDVDPLPPSDVRMATWMRRLKIRISALAKRKRSIKRMVADRKRYKTQIVKYRKSGDTEAVRRAQKIYQRIGEKMKRLNRLIASLRQQIRKLKAKLAQPATVAGLSGLDALSDLGMLGSAHIDVGPIESMALNGLPDEIDPDLAGFMDQLKDFGKRILGQAIPAAASVFFPEQVQNIQSIQAARLMQGDSIEAERLMKAERNAIRKLNNRMAKITKKMEIEAARARERGSSMRRLMPIGIAAGAAVIAGLALFGRRKR